MTDSKFDLDRLKLYFGDPYIIQAEAGNNLTIYQPTVGDIVTAGEKDVYDGVSIFAGNPTMFRLSLWKAGIDWNKISDYELFFLLYQTLDMSKTKLLFGDLNFQDFKPNQYKLDDGSLYNYLYNEKKDIIIDEKIHHEMSLYIRYMFNYFPKTEKAKGKSTKEWMIEEDARNAEKLQDEPAKSSLLPLISSCLNHPGFKYKKNELRDVGIVEFMDSVQRLQIYEQTSALLKGMYGGFIDTSKINKEEFNFMRDIATQ